MFQLYTDVLRGGRGIGRQWSLKSNEGEGVTKHTTLLVVGDEDLRRLNGHEKSSKHRKVEQLIANGQPIRILCESDFRRIVFRPAAVSSWA